MPLVEKRYAEALISISERDGAIDDYQQELQMVVDIYKSQQDFKLFLLNPEVKTDIKKLVITNSFNGRLKNNLVNFLALLLDKARIINLPGILDEYIKIADKIRNTLNITIISASELDNKQVKQISEKYKQIYNATNVKVNVEIDKSLIGGVKVKIGDKLVDGSIVGRLESLREVLLRS
jgi:F-type H+-transporting ATPase subunit delta